MNRFRITFSYVIEQANDDGQYEPFDNSTRTIHHLKRHQMKKIEGLLLGMASDLHAEGMKHPDARIFDQQALEDAMRNAMACAAPPPVVHTAGMDYVKPNPKAKKK